MTNKQIDNRVKKLQALEAKQKELEVQAEAIRDELKGELDAKEATQERIMSFIISADK